MSYAPERKILRDIRLAVGGRPDVVLWRNSAGVAEHISGNGKVDRVPYGLCHGASDLIGLIRPTGRFLAIEVKTRKGKLSHDQKAFLELVKKSGGVAGVARSAEEAHEIVDTANMATALAGDEIDVVNYIKKRLVDGKRTYGQLDIGTDRRDWDGELFAELADALVYMACKKIAGQNVSD